MADTSGAGGAGPVIERWPLTGRSTQLDLFLRALDDAGCDGLLLRGPPGVGKTRLADELLAAAAETGRRGLAAVATRTSASVPLGALAHLLPAGLGSAPDLFQRVRDALAEEAGGAGIVLLVDDVDQLDPTSAMLVGQLASVGRVFLVGTVRSDQVIPDAIDVLARGDRLATVDVDPLARDAVDTLLHRVLGGPLDEATSLALWEASEGNVLFLRELVVAGRSSGGLHEDQGVWRLDGPLLPGGRLRDTIAARLEQAPPAAQPVLELLATCGPVGVDDLEPMASLTVLEDLEREGLIEVTVSGRRHDAALSHPLHGEVIRSEMGALTGRKLLQARARQVQDHGARRREDPLRIATWQLAAGGTVGGDLLMEAARLARHARDFPTVEAFARAAHHDRPTAEAGMLLGEALFEQGEFEEARDVLERASTEEGHEELHAPLAVARSTNLFWGCLLPDDAIAVRREARERATSEVERDELLASEANLLVFGGRPAEALALLEALDADRGGERGQVLRAIALAPALAMAGRTAEAIAVAEEGYERQQGMDLDQVLPHPVSHVLSEVLALCDGGRIDEALGVAQLGYGVALADKSTIGRIWFALNLGRGALVQGRPATADRWCREAAALASRTGFRGQRSMALAGCAVAAAWLGDTARADANAAASEADAAGFRFLAPERALGRAWAAAAIGDNERACGLLRAAATDAGATGHLTSESWLLHDAARLGAAAEVADRLDELAARCDGTLVVARAVHARGLAEHSVDLLVEAVDRLEAMGVVIAGAEAATAAAEVLREAGDRRAAQAMDRRAARLAGRGEGARTTAAPTSAAVDPLSSREREIAVLAAQGESSRAIAKRMFLSVRTVDNHLQKAYRKLGVRGRDELATALESESAAG